MSVKFQNILYKEPKKHFETIFSTLVLLFNKLPKETYTTFCNNPFLISSQQALIIAFACNAKNFAIAILFFFSFPWSLLLDRPPKVFL